MVGVYAVAKNKSIGLTDEMIEAGIKEYLLPYRGEDDPREVVTAIFLAMQQAQHLSPPPSSE